MTELESFIVNENSSSGGKSKNMLVINDSDYKSTKPTNLNFSTKYLTFREEINLMMFKNFTVYSRNIKTLIFVFLTPIFFLTILQLLQILSNYHSKSIVVKDHMPKLIDDVDLNCLKNPFGVYREGCISIGIAVIGLLEDKEKSQVDFLLDSIANQTNLVVGSSIDLISNGSHEDMYDYFNKNLNKVQYAIALCYGSFEIAGVSVPCRPSLKKESTDFNLYTIVYNITTVPNGFLDSFSLPLPTDERLVRLKMVVDNAYLSYYHKIKNNSSLSTPPQLKNIYTQALPSPPSRLITNANVVSLFGCFYLYFPPMILFSILLLDLVKEKESKLKNYMNLYGLSLIAYWTSWIIIALISSTIVTLEITILGKFIFHYDLFDNVNIFVPFTLFFLFSFTMQIFAMYLSCLVKDSQSGTTVTYSFILIGIIIQCFFTNYGLIYFFFATNLDSLWLLVKIVSILLHFYPPFLFSKSYLNITRICSFHFDSPKLQWIPGRYFNLADLFSKEVGKLRIGVEFEVDSLFQTFIWFYFLIIFLLIMIAFSEMKDSYKYDKQRFKNKKWCDIRAFFRNKLRLYKDLYSLTSVKKLNIRKQQMENMINKNYDTFFKNEQKTIPSGDENLSFIVKENDISVVNEKRLVASLNKKRTIPNGIRLLGVSKVYESGLRALSDVNIEISKGEVFTILGPNGAGKSTLINILTSQISSTEGFAKVGPFIIHSDLFIDSIYVKRMVGICSQSDFLWEELSVYETLFLYSRLRGIKENKIAEYIDQKIAQVGLEKKKHELVSKLSGGMRRRLSICISTLGDPLIIFMDEPTSGLDPNNRRKIWKLINTIKQNRVIILSTHLMDEAEYLSDRLGLIINGKLRFVGNCTDLRKLHLDGIILTLTVDLTKLDKQFFLFDDNIKYTFIHSQINYSSSGIYQIMIKHENKRDIIKAFEIFKRKSQDQRIVEMFDYLKDSAISQSNLESVYLDLCKKYK